MDFSVLVNACHKTFKCGTIYSNKLVFFFKKNQVIYYLIEFLKTDFLILNFFHFV